MILLHLLHPRRINERQGLGECTGVMIHDEFYTGDGARKEGERLEEG